MTKSATAFTPSRRLVRLDDADCGGVSVLLTTGGLRQHVVSGARGVPSIIGHLPDYILRPMLETLRPVQVSWFVAGKDEGDTESDAGLRNGTLLPWRSLSIEERSLALLRAFDRPLWSQSVWKSNVGRPTPSTRRCARDRVGSMAWRFTKVHAILLRITLLTD